MQLSVKKTYDFLTKQKVDIRMKRIWMCFIVLFSFGLLINYGSVSASSGGGVTIPAEAESTGLEFGETSDGLPTACLRDNYGPIDFLKLALGYSTKKSSLDSTGNETVGFFELFVVAFFPAAGCDYNTALNTMPEESELVRYGLVGVADKQLHALIYQQPTINVVAHMKDEWVPGVSDTNSTVYAGEGYDFLMSTGIDYFWEISRNFAYLLFVIVLIAAGFMIMFRNKIGGQMAVTVFNTLPNVIVALILVTFSFAIAGVILDLGSLLTTIVANIFSNQGVNTISVTNPFSLMGFFLEGGKVAAEGVSDALSGVGLGSIIAIGVGALVSGLGVIGGLLALILFLVMIVIVMFVSFRVFFTLIKAYVMIILDVIVGPVVIAFGAVPGKSSMMKQWFFRLIKNTLVFVIVFALVNFAMFILVSDISIGFPTGLATGDLSDGSTAEGFITLLIKYVVVPLFLFNLAAQAPKLLDDLLPSDGGKGVGAAMQGVTDNFKKIPVIGGFF